MTDWRVEWRSHPERFVGRKLDVTLVADKSRHTGTLVRLEPLTIDHETIDDYPVIALDDGREIGGLECWWIPKETR